MKSNLTLHFTSILITSPQPNLIPHVILHLATSFAVLPYVTYTPHHLIHCKLKQRTFSQ